MHKGLIKLWHVLLLSPITFLVVLFLGAALFLNEAIRALVAVLLWLRHGRKAHLVQEGADAVWEYKGTGNTRMVLVPLVLTQGGNLDVEHVASEIEKRIFGSPSLESTYKKLKCILATFSGYVCWKDADNFDVRNHVRRLYGNEIYTEEDVSELLSGLCQDMDDSKPQWEILIIRRFMSREDTAEKSILIFRFHHGFMDGMSLLMMLEKLSEDFKYQLHPLTSGIPFWKMALYYSNALLFGSLQCRYMIRNSFRKHWITTSESFGKKRFVWSRNGIKIETLQRIRSQLKVSIPNVVAFAFAEGCRRVLSAERLLDTIYLGELLAMLPYPNCKPQNRFMGYSYTANISREYITTFSLKERLAHLKAEATEGILGPQPLLVYYLFKLVGRLPTMCFPLFMSGTQDSCYLSYVPCSKDKFSIFQAECEAVGAFPACFNETGITLGSASYGNFLSVCGASDTSWLSEKELTEILHQIPVIIDELVESILGPKNNENLVDETIILNGNGLNPDGKMESFARSDSSCSGSELSVSPHSQERLNEPKPSKDDENQNVVHKRRPNRNRVKKSGTQVR